MLQVLRRENQVHLWKLKSNVWVAVQHSTFWLLVVEVIHLVRKNGVVLKCQEPVRKSPWNEELRLVVPSKKNWLPLSERWRVCANVKGKVNNRTLYNPYQFRLCPFSRLPMKPTEHALDWHTLVVLYEMAVNSKLPISQLLVRLWIPAPVVRELVWLNNHQSPNHVIKFHCHTVIYHFLVKN